MEGTHEDDEQLSFIHIAAATANVVRYLSNQKRIEDDRRSDEDSRRDNDKAEEEARAELARVKARLRQLAITDKKLALLRARVWEDPD